jgi:DNA-binding MarR family transcriptional regulator
MASVIDTSLVARQILEVIPLVMRTVASQVRRSEHVLAAPHFRLLWMLSRRSFTLSELADHQSVSLPTISNSISILEKRGWVRRSRLDDDRRKVLIELSSAGRAVFEEVQQHAEAHVKARLSSLNEVDQNALLAGLSVLRTAFSDAASCTASDPTS